MWLINGTRWESMELLQSQRWFRAVRQGIPFHAAAHQIAYPCSDATSPNGWIKMLLRHVYFLAIVPERFTAPRPSSVLPIFPLIRPICFPLFLARPQIFVALPFFPPRLVPVHVPALERLKRAAVHVTLTFCRFLLLTGTLPGNFIFCALPISNE